MKKHAPYWLYVAGSLCFIYVFVRSITIPLTFDEIWTIGTVVNRSFIDIFTYSELGSNNHILNSLFVRLIYEGEPWLFRLPNVLAFLVYAWFSIRLIGTIPNKWMQAMAFILCFCNPFLLEFFSLCRGYGLALACTAGALYSLKQSLSLTNTSAGVSTTLIWSALAVLANFVWLNFFLAVLPILVYIEWVKFKTFTWQFWLRMSIPTLLLFALILRPLIKLREGNELWYGGKSGLVYDTFTSLIQGIMGFKSPDLPAHLVLGALAIVLILLFLVHVRSGISMDRALRSDSLVFLSVFVLLCAVSLLQNFLFHTPFLVNRTALVYLLPLIWLILSACASSMEKRPWQVASGATLLLSLAALVNFIHLANFTHSYSWPFDSKSDVVMAYLNKVGEERQDTINLDHSWIIGASLGYIQKTKNYPWVKRIQGEPDSARKVKVDYYYLYDYDRQYAGYSAYNALPDSFFRDTALYFREQDLILLKIRE